MAKHGGAKSSRKQRKVQRERSERAQRHGLPAKLPEKRVELSASRAGESSGGGRPKLKGQGESAHTEELEGGARPAKTSLRDRIARIPQWAQLAIGGAVVLIVVFVAARFRGADGKSVATPPPTPSRVTPGNELAGVVSSALAVSATDSSSPPEPSPSAPAPAVPKGSAERQAPPAPVESAAPTPRPTAAPPAPSARAVVPAQTVAKPAAPDVPAPPPSPPRAASPPSPPVTAPSPEDNPY